MKSLLKKYLNGPYNIVQILVSSFVFSFIWAFLIKREDGFFIWLILMFLIWFFIELAFNKFVYGKFYFPYK